MRTPQLLCSYGNINNYLSFSILVGVYVHWPYCVRRCSYCNFNKYIQKSSGGSNGQGDRNEKRMVNCLKMEAETVIQRIAGAKKISSIFFGGGTPSLMSPKSIKVRQA